jgi:hypothetical protein
LDLRFGVLERDGLVFAETTRLMLIDSALLTDPIEPRVCTEPSVCVLDSVGRAVVPLINSFRASGVAIPSSAALLFTEPCKLYMLSLISVRGLIFSSVVVVRSLLVIFGALAFEDCMMIGLAQGFRMDVPVDSKLEIEALEGTCRSWFLVLVSSLIRAISAGRGGRMTSGTLPAVRAWRLVDL